MSKYGKNITYNKGGLCPLSVPKEWRDYVRRPTSATLHVAIRTLLTLQIYEQLLILQNYSLVFSLFILAETRIPCLMMHFLFSYVSLESFAIIGNEISKMKVILY